MKFLRAEFWFVPHGKRQLWKCVQTCKLNDLRAEEDAYIWMERNAHNRGTWFLVNERDLG